MRTLSASQVMVPLVVLFTAGHLALRWSQRNDRQAHDVSPLHVGETVSAPLPPPVDGLDCLRVVVFSPDCPFCQHAADRENETLTDRSRSERLWYTDQETATLPYFVKQHLRREPGISADLIRALKIEAVPALFILSPRGEIRWVGSYYGNESDQELANRCTDEPQPGPDEVTSNL